MISNIRHSFVRRIILCFFACCTLYPFLLILLTSLKSPSDFSANSIGLPKEWKISNYWEVYLNAHILSAFWNSFFITALSVIAQVGFGSLAAYAITKMNFKYSKLFLAVFLIPLVFSIQIVIIPLFLLFKYAHLLNSLFGAIIIYTATGLPMAIFILSKFMKTIPDAIIESGFIDGAGHLRCYFRLIMPLIQPAIMTLFIIGGLAIWNDFFVPLMFFTNGTITTLPLSIYHFIQDHGSEWTLISADIVYSIVPIVIIFILLQKYILSGVVTGSIKG